MMKRYHLLNVANQSFNTRIGTNVITIFIHTFHEYTFVDIMINGTMIQAGVMATANSSLFSGQVNSVLGGTIYFECIGGVSPSFKTFNDTTCRLVYSED